MNKVDETYLFIKRFLAEKGYPPTIREICKGIDIKSTSTISYYLKKLEESNRIVKGSYKNRALQLTENVQPVLNAQARGYDGPFDYINIPLVGTIAAGSPILAEQNIMDNITFSENLFRGRDLFMLKVKGESMVGVGIMNGDYVVISKQDVAQNGEIVAAMIDGEATVKRFYKKEDHFILHPENALLDDIITDHVIILGKVVGLIRNRF